MNRMVDFEYGSIESRRQAIQMDIDSGKSAAERNRLGQFATPNALAIDIVRYVETILGQTTGNIRFADPSVGSGSFFSAALAIFGPKRISSAVGVELDPAFADAARKLWGDAGLEIVRDDFTRVVANGSCPPAPNVILANPPYVRHQVGLGNGAVAVVVRDLCRVSAPVAESIMLSIPASASAPPARPRVSSRRATR